MMQAASATVAVWNVFANLFVKAHHDSRLAAEILDSSSSSSSLFVDMTVVQPGEFLRCDGCNVDDDDADSDDVDDEIYVTVAE